MRLGRRTRAGLAGGGLTAIAAAVVIAVAQANGDRTTLPAVSRDGDGSEPTTVPAAAASPSTPARPSVRVERAFPRLPQLDRPVVLVEVPGQRLILVVLQDGRVVSFPNDPNASEITTVLDQQPITSRDGNEEGLLGLALDPDFAQNNRLYVYYSVTPGERRTVLARLTATGSGANLRVDPGSRLVLLEIPQPFSNHKGGTIAFGPDRMLYLALGDGGSAGDPRGNGQDLKANLLGSILRLDVRNATRAAPYTIPPDNPFAAATDGTQRETWAYGLRNPWRFSFDPATGRLWAGDVGQNAREEIDVIEKGRNYGWNVMEGSNCFQPREGCNRQGIELPVAEYGREGGNCSVTGGHVYRGRATPSLTGWYVYGDFCTGKVWAIPGDPGAARGSTPIELLARGPQISSFAVDAAGELYILAFDGRLYRFVE